MGAVNTLGTLLPLDFLWMMQLFIGHAIFGRVPNFRHDLSDFTTEQTGTMKCTWTPTTNSVT